MGIQRVLRTANYNSNIYVQTADRDVEHLTIDYRNLPDDSCADNILIHHFSIGSRASRVAFALPERMILIYHNITPPEWFAPYSLRIAHTCAAGRLQLAKLCGRTALALGADRGIHIETDEEVQSLEAAKLLKAVVEKEEPKLVILGKQSIDSDNNQTGQMLAALTGMGQGTFASEVVVDGDKVNVTREVDGGLMTVALNLPAVVTTDLRLNEPRYASLPNIMKAKKKPLDAMSPADLGVEIAPRLTTLKVEAPAARQAGIKVADVAELVDKLKNEAKVI